MVMPQSAVALSSAGQHGQWGRYALKVILGSLFCSAGWRLYFAATSGVCLIRSGAAGFQMKLQSQKNI
jgi:hypothetical protein